MRLTLSISEVIAIGTLFTGIFLYVGTLKERLAKCEWRLSITEKDINASRQAIERDVIKKFSKDLSKAESILYSYEALLRNLQIRCNSIESYLQENTGYRPTDTNTDFDNRR